MRTKLSKSEPNVYLSLLNIIDLKMIYRFKKYVYKNINSRVCKNTKDKISAKIK